jgi:hypothetical protein
MKRSHSGPEISNSLANELWAAVKMFVAWLEISGYDTYDPYDIWGTRYGKFSRRMYYQKHVVGILLTAPVLLMEIFFPRLRTLFVKKDRYPTADAQLALAFLNLYKAGRRQQNAGERRVRSDQQSKQWLAKARDIADELLSQSAPGYSGLGWGYPFDWQGVTGLMPKGTPHITATPYCYEVFTTLFDVTGEEHYLNVARSIADFVFENLNDTMTGEDSAASSYTPYDRTKIVNASAYRAFVLFDAAQRFRDDGFRAKAWNNLRFILQSQRKDGSWLYAIDDPDQAFIDHFHTCFVLKNLHKMNRVMHRTEVAEAIERGYAWYRKALFDNENNPKCFAVAPRLEVVRLEMYGYAEAITLGVLLKNDIPAAFALAEQLATELIRRYQLPSGHWVTRIYQGGIRHTVPFLRWPQAQLFLAITNLLLSEEHTG